MLRIIKKYGRFICIVLSSLFTVSCISSTDIDFDSKNNITSDNDNDAAIALSPQADSVKESTNGLAADVPAVKFTNPINNIVSYADPFVV